MMKNAPVDLVPTAVEELVIGQVLYSKDVISRAALMLKPHHFGNKRCSIIYGACLELWRNETGVDLVTVYMELKKRGQITPGEGAYTLANYTYHVASTIHFEDHASIVLDQFKRRTLLNASNTLYNAIEDNADTSAAIAQMNADLDSAIIADVETDVSGAHVAYELMNNPNKPKPIYLGMRGLDDYLFILPGNVITVKGEPGAGKTAFVLSAVLNLLPQVKVWMVSLEMNPSELMTRALCQLAEVDIDLALQDKLLDQDKERMAMCANNYGDMLDRLRIEPAESMEMDVLRSKGEHMVKRRGIGLIVLDYAQLVDADPKRYPSQVQQLEAVSKTVRAIARKNDVPILEVVHISKDGSEHGTKQFEKDAHARIAISMDATGARFVDLLKNRNGQTKFGLPLPCKMRHGMVGRETPPAWAPSHIKPVDRRQPDQSSKPDDNDEPPPF